MGLADKLGLSRRPVYTIATITLHELAQVPLVNAKFRVKWKVKGATSAHHGGLGGEEDGGNGVLDGLAAGKAHPLRGLAARARTTSSSASLTLDSTAEDSSSSSKRSQDHLPSPTTPQPDSPDLRTPNPNRTPGPSFGFNSQHLGSPSSFGAYPDSPNPSWITSGTGAFLSPSTSTSPSTFADEFPSKRRSHDVPPPSARTEAKGTTGLEPLRSHTATFNTTIRVPVAIPVQGTSGSRCVLQSSPVQLSVRQEIMVDGGTKEEVRIGEVLLDLAQFVGNGKGEAATPRRYLLKDCKTNATLRITVRMEWAGGEPDFIAPPLRSGQVQESSASGSQVFSSTTFNKSSSSLSSRKPSTSSLQNAGGPTHMVRTPSTSSSVSTQSIRSSHHSGSPKVSKGGWHPPTSSFSSSSAHALLGGAGDSDRSANDIIDSIFNRARRASVATAPLDRPRESWVTGPAAFLPSSRIAPLPQLVPPSIANWSSSPAILMKPRKYSTASANSNNSNKSSKSRVVRWGDDETPSPPKSPRRTTAPPVKSASSSSLSALGNVSEDPLSTSGTKPASEWDRVMRGGGNEEEEEDLDKGLESFSFS